MNDRFNIKEWKESKGEANMRRLRFQLRESACDPLLSVSSHPSSHTHQQRTQTDTSITDTHSSLLSLPLLPSHVSVNYWIDRYCNDYLITRYLCV